MKDEGNTGMMVILLLACGIFLISSSSAISIGGYAYREYIFTPFVTKDMAKLGEKINVCTDPEKC